MSDDVLLRFLSCGLIDVGGDDAKLEKLRRTASDLTVALKKIPSKATSFALVAFDPDAPSNDPVIHEAIEALKKRWPTYVNTFSGTPVAVIRAMLLDALVQAARGDDKVAVAFATSARNALPFMEAGGERAIWADVLGEIERQVDIRAETEWATPASISVQAMKFAAPPAVEVKTSPGKVNKDDLHKKFEAAAGPNNRAGAATEGNRYWPNSHQQWVYEFTPRLADAVAETIDAVAAKFSVAPIDFSEPLRQLATAVSTHVEATLNAVSGATAGLQRRTNLLWWKEALFSPSARVSYRELPGAGAAALMAFDLHQQVPTFSPASVAAFLRETVLSLPTVDDQKKWPVQELLEAVRTDNNVAGLREAAAELVAAPVGRGPLLALIGHRESRPTIDGQAFRDLAGVPPDTSLTLPEWAAWIFRELQAARATSDDSGARRRVRRG